jgi:acyl-CoA hydrolase
MSASALLKSRVRRPSYLNKLAKAEDLIDLFPHGSYIGWSGFTGVGYPKYVLCNWVLHSSHHNPFTLNCPGLL